MSVSFFLQSCLVVDFLLVAPLGINEAKKKKFRCATPRKSRIPRVVVTSSPFMLACLSDLAGLLDCAGKFVLTSDYHN